MSVSVSPEYRALRNSDPGTSILRVVCMFALVGLVHPGCHGAQQTQDQRREAMVREQLEARGISDHATLRAMRTVPRHLFVPDESVDRAYEDGPLPIGGGQTISQPYIVAVMTELASPGRGKRALEIGTGSGYQAAVLAETFDSVFTIEIVSSLARSARERLARLGFRSVQVREGDGYAGWPECGPFDAILVTAAAPEIPGPLLEQLAEGGRLIMPVGSPWSVQNLVVVERHDGRLRRRNVFPVRFVPFTRSDSTAKVPEVR